MHCLCVLTGVHVLSCIDIITSLMLGHNDEVQIQSRCHQAFMWWLISMAAQMGMSIDKPPMDGCYVKLQLEVERAHSVWCRCGAQTTLRECTAFWRVYTASSQSSLLAMCLQARRRCASCMLPLRRCLPHASASGQTQNHMHS